MREHYEDPDPDEPRKTITFPGPLVEQIDAEDGLPTEPEAATRESPSATAVHFEHPNGEEGIMLMLIGEEQHFAEAFDLYSPNPNMPMNLVLKHKADGGNNFVSYRADDDAGVVLIEMTEEKCDEVTLYLQNNIAP